MKTDIVLWTCILAPPTAWMLNLETNFALAPLACTTGSKFMLQAVSAVALIIAITSAVTSWMQWEKLPVEHNPTQQRARTLALSGILLSAMFALVIIAQTLPHFILSPCE